VVIWYLFPRFGVLYQEQSDNPVHDIKRRNRVYIPMINISAKLKEYSWRGATVNAIASGSEDRGFESCQGESFLKFVCTLQ
jgi:hypothetical protein